jgi:superfamily II DNA or RNA helicase
MLHLSTLAATTIRLVDPCAVIGQVDAGCHEWGAPITVASVQILGRPEHLKAVRCIFGEPVFSASIIDLVEHGYLYDLRAIAVPTTTSLDTLHTQDGDFKTDKLEEVIDTPERNERIVHAYLEHCKGRQALCFTVTIAHARRLAETFTRMHVSASVVSGETPPEERRRILHDYERSQLEVVCNCGVLLEGYDTPHTSCIIMARPTQSRALFVQALGRGTRLAPGKRDCIIRSFVAELIQEAVHEQQHSDRHERGGA